MDSIFNLEETKRSSLLQQIIQSFGFTYVCLWSHFPHHSNCLIFIDGVYNEENNNQASSLSGSLAMRSFLDYQKSMFFVDNYTGRVPGFAFMHNLPYMERKGFDLLKLASNATQLQFYQEARIKAAIFMGCEKGEIELGMSNDSSHINFEIELKKLFPGDFPQEVLAQPLDQTRPSSSSSSLRSLSMENSADYPPFLFNIPQTTSYIPEIYGFKEPYLDQQAAPNQTPSSSTMRPEDSLEQTLMQITNNQMIPSREHEEAAMTRAILAAISTASSSPPPPFSSDQLQASRVASAFKSYQTYLGPTNRGQHRQNLNKRSLSFFRNLSEARAQQQYRITRPTSNQLHHMMSERKRREKLNESFQALRSVLPPGSKKDKASVLLNIKEYIGSLKSQVEELTKINNILEAERSGNVTPHKDSRGIFGERLIIGLTDVEQSTSESQVVDLEVNVRGDLILRDLIVRILEFMKQVEDVTVMSIDARTQLLETQTIMNRIVLRLGIQGSEWDKSNFQEAMKRVLDDLAQ